MSDSEEFFFNKYYNNNKIYFKVKQFILNLVTDLQHFAIPNIA